MEKSKILDGLIEEEEKMTNGFTVFNRGSELQNSLISADKVKSYVYN